MSVQKLNSQNFDASVLKSDKLTFVDFSAVWCGPCKMFGPIFDEFANENGDKVNCASIDIDESRDIAMRYGINAVPTTLVFKNGQVVGQMVGLSNKQALIQEMSKHI
ncbi:MAG: thioredoxin [Coriobacteriales bacterium]|jgi:thioredoxin 1